MLRFYTFTYVVSRTQHNQRDSPLYKKIISTNTPSPVFVSTFPGALSRSYDRESCIIQNAVASAPSATPGLPRLCPELFYREELPAKVKHRESFPRVNDLRCGSGRGQPHVRGLICLPNARKEIQTAFSNVIFKFPHSNETSKRCR